VRISWLISRRKRTAGSVSGGSGGAAGDVMAASLAPTS
jgi:hypothetical protein